MKFKEQDIFFWTFSVVAIKHYYKDADPCEDLFKEINEHYEMFIPIYLEDMNKQREFTTEAINYFATLID
jgi:hypothetical protein